ncbi:cytochrome-c peroxidase [Alterinioella nitratireducens]|uniref:cytochrome-c peroxidase n=1 Tax=Alterinioella nitratireducens TaxID=2735915 RepID=UPI0015518470|nr:cytochrome c peroxidase [Alterinioella nitratireducens]NPD19832.1 cytochrome-c peroxidase [Alterinioella nitratireducens]
MRWLILALLPLPALAFAQQFPPVDWMTTDPARVELGQLLFYDPILSGNREVSCATCHNPAQGTSDGLSLGLGDGGIGLGPERRADPANLPEQRIPRNAPALFNLGAAEFSVMFHDGRLEADPTRPGGIRTPLGEDMVSGFTSVLAAQAMFPVLSGDEMAGHYSENEIAQAVRMGFLSQPGGAWERIAARVAAIPEYRARFDAVLGQGAEIRFTDIGNVIAEFIADEWRADDSPFDRYLEGEPLPAAAERGRALFYGDAGCSTCHAGRFQTDQDFHAIAMVQIGPGKAARFESHARDEGRMRVTGDPADAYAFRTPSLRNVTQTAPYGHAGAYATLEGVIRHHLDPVAALMGYDQSQAVLPALDVADWRVLEDEAEMAAIAAANELAPMVLSDPEIADLIAFLDALTDPREDRLGVPDAVPSGLPVAR